MAPFEHHPGQHGLHERFTAYVSPPTVETPALALRQVDNGGGCDCSRTNLDGGAIAGIVIGSIVGFLLICWVLRSCFGIGSPNATLVESSSPPREKNYYHHRQRRRVPASPVLDSPPRVAVRGRPRRDSSRRSSVVYA